MIGKAPYNFSEPSLINTNIKTNFEQIINKTDIYTFRYNGDVWQEIGRVQNMAQT